MNYPSQSLLSRKLSIFVIFCACLPSSLHAASGFPSLSALNQLLDYFPTNGPLDDATCNVEDLEKANDSQLHVILQEIQATAFFRNFVVDLDAKCPLRSWRKTKETSSSDKASAIPSSSTTDSDPGDNKNKEEDDDEEEFKCAGNPDDDDEEDAVPLCHVDGGSDDPFSTPSSLLSLSQDGFQSEAQKDTFSWKKQTNMVVVDEENESKQQDCDNDELPDTFWVDICRNIQAGDGTSVVNLAKNPERNTYYNGTHIWNAIYEENCIFSDSNLAARVMDKDTPHNGMCFEERVLYRLLSGLHTSTTLSIAMNYYAPSKKKNRTSWEPNPAYFMSKFQSNPQHIRNLHFSYVVLLRALQKAGPYLSQYEIRTGDIVQDETATVLLRRLLDSAILQSCANVFSAFDESLMFQDSTDLSLHKNFKGMFHNVSSILDCVQCQQCKLHGKMTMLGYGTALKILFMEQQAELSRNELVAFVNTIAKFSESIRHVRELTHLYWEEEEAKLHRAVNALPGSLASTPVTGSRTAAQQDHVTGSIDLVDAAVETIASLGQDGSIGWDREAELVQLALERNPELLILAKYYGTQNPTKFLELSKSIAGSSAMARVSDLPDAIIIGSGLAGLAAALNILDRGGTVVILEKEHLLGGNSNKASSGINAYVPATNDAGDSLDIFRNDTTRSAGSAARPDLIEVLVANSGDAVTWLKERVGVDLSLKAQLGGHSSKRTHRPSNGMAGAEIIYGIQKAVKSYQKKKDRVKIMVDTKAKKLLTEKDGTVVVGVEYTTLNSDGSEGETRELRSPNVILATGGFASDRSHGSYLEQHRPELLNMPTTAGAFSTGDGIALATALGAGVVDMDKVQVHPTGWVDPKDPENTSKTLAAELMRGVGGILMNKKGQRFCNELGTRAYVTERMLSHDKKFAETGKWDVSSAVQTFSLVLSSSAAEDAKKHVDLYSHKGLLTRFEGVQALSDWMKLPKNTVVKSLKEYQADAAKGIDKYGKKTFRGVPAKDLEKEVFYAGTVTPVLHYCMGGITIDKEGNVVNESGEIIQGLHAAGEVTGGVHGANRLGGNSLLECTVFGTIVGKKIAIQAPSRLSQGLASKTEETESFSVDREIPLAELQEHNTGDDCWVAIGGVVYDLTEFAEEHPAGPVSVHELAGKDGTEAFAAVHNDNMLQDFAEYRKGTLKA